MQTQAATGIVTHGGWAMAVTVADSSEGQVVIDRRRLTLAAPGLPDHPYHHEALTLSPAKGEALVQRVHKAIAEQARHGLDVLRQDLAVSFELATIALREPRPLPPTFAEVLGSRAVYYADSEMYRDAVEEAARDLDMRVVLYPKDQEFEFGAGAINSNPTEAAERIRSWRKTLGAPWQKDHHLAAAAALGALSRVLSAR